MRLIVEHAYTRDARIPLLAGDDDLVQGWQSVPVPPSAPGHWEIFDWSPDRKTGWRCFRIVWERVQ
jgi:hypothetical protein